MLYQMIVGAWPCDLDPTDSAGIDAFAVRLSGWQQKALREAKLASNWITPNEAYEQAADRFLRALLAPASPSLHDLATFAQSVMAAGAANGLAQVLSKLTAPGVPDLYQGTEYWDFSLVDPDNRRPVDFRQRADSQERTTVADSLPTWRDGRVKQQVIAAALRCRSRDPDIFATGDYLPVSAAGPMADHVFGFVRSFKKRGYLTLALRQPGKLLRNWNALSPDPNALADTVVTLPSEPVFDEISGMPLKSSGMRVSAGDLLTVLPVALFRLF
jgi:maltooligosyltrehalose synthase